MKLVSWQHILFEKLNQWWTISIKIIPNILFAIVAFAFFVLIARMIRRLVNSLVSKISGKASVSNLLGNVSYVFILFIGLFVALDILQLNKAVASLLAGAGVIGIVLGFAFQDLSSNFISGIFIAFRKPFDVGHTIETNGFIGNIEEIQLRSTIMRTFQGMHVMIPNKDIFQKAILNYSLTLERRIELEFSIANEHDVLYLIEKIKETVSTLNYLVVQKPVEVYCIAFGENSIRLAVWMWIYNHQPPGYMVAQHDVIACVIKACTENNISLIIPVAYQTNSDKNFLNSPITHKQHVK
jgi:small conductance mechanosensitive channel